jgi:hypothetical protein
MNKTNQKNTKNKYGENNIDMNITKKQIVKNKLSLIDINNNIQENDHVVKVHKRQRRKSKIYIET